MEILSLVISLIAVSLSFFSFYWVYLRTKRNLQLVPINRILSDKAEFAIVNNGTMEILLISIHWAMQGKNNSSKTFPGQESKILDNGAFNLEPGKSYRIQTSFKRSELKEFALEEGIADTSTTPEGRRIRLSVQIGWVDNRSGVLQSEVDFYELSFFEGGVAGGPVLKKPKDLYRTANETSGVF